MEDQLTEYSTDKLEELSLDLKCLIILNKGRGMTVFVAMLQNQH
jgi:hypothetical protein